jgi:phosphate transport system substrate-binding protein
MNYPKKALVRMSVVLLALTATPPVLITTLDPEAVQAQAPSPSPSSFPLPESLPDGSNLTVDGSSSMSVINEALKQRFEARFPDASVDLAANGTLPSLESLLNGEVNLAAIGRALTDDEKAQGLIEVPVSREKIAIIVGPNNPFDGDITFEQFARIFQGDITDWSELGGEPGPIRFVDRPDSSDTRQSFSQYDVFQQSEFATGANAIQVDEDDTAAVINELGNDGIGYAIADQVLGLDSVKIVPMHQTLPDDPRYPFSQPRGYVYRETPDPVTQAFLGFATSAPGQEAVAEAKEAEAEAVDAGVASPSAAESPVAAVSPDAATSPAAVAPTEPAETAQVPATDEGAVATRDRGGLWWLWLLPLLALGGLLWWLLGRRPAAAPVAAGAVVPPPPVDEGRIILTPRDCRHAYAYWEVPERYKANVRERGGRNLALRLYDVTDIDLDQQPPHSMKQFDCRESEPDLHVPIALDNRDYLAELGYMTDDGQWLSLVRSKHVRVPACVPVGDGATRVGGAALATGAAALGGAAIAAGAAARSASATPAAPVAPIAPVPADGSRIILTARSPEDAYAYWELPESLRADLNRPGGPDLKLRLYDVTDIDFDQQPAHGYQEYDCYDRDSDRHIPVPAADRDYLAEIGYPSERGWVKIARSNTVRVPSVWVTSNGGNGGNRGNGGNLGAIAGGAVAAAAAGLGTAALRDRTPEQPAVSEPVVSEPIVMDGEVPAVPSIPTGQPTSRIVLSPRSEQEILAAWETPEAHKALVKRQGGRDLKLRLYDVTDIDLDEHHAHSIQQFDCNEQATEVSLPVPLSDRDYVVEIGYVTEDDRWLKLARSEYLRVPAALATPPAASTPPISTATAIGATAAAIGTVGAVAATTPDTRVTASVGAPLGTTAGITTAEGASRCSIQTLIAHSRRNCYRLDDHQMRQLQEQVSVSKTLEPGTYVVRIKDGTFGYDAVGTGHADEPIVVLWIQGGRIVNKQTDIPVTSTWSTLNGYADALTLDVLETTTLHALFFDTYLDDNAGDLTLTIVKLPALAGR